MLTVCGYMPTTKDAIGDRLRRLRQETGLTQHEASSRVGVEPRQWQRWESGRNAPRETTLRRISETFGFDVQEFFQGLPDDEMSQLDRIETKLDRIEGWLAGEEGLSGDVFAEPADDVPVVSPADQAG